MGGVSDDDLPVDDELPPDELAAEAEDPDAGEHYVRPVDKLHRSAAGAALNAAMLGLHDAFYGPKEKDEVAVVSPAPGKPDDPADPIDVHLDAEDKRRSVVYLRRPPADPPT